MASVLVLKALPAWAQQQSVSVTFKNNTQGTVQVYWLNNNQEQLFKTLQAGESGVQQTYTTHVWIVRDAGGQQLNRVTVSANTGEILAAPGDQSGMPNASDTNPQAGPQSMTEQARAAVTYLNQVRADPKAFSSRINVNLGNIQARPALAWNDILARVAEAKALELANETTRRKALWISHVSPNGEGINIRMLRAGYKIPADWAEPLDKNFFENIGSHWDQSPNPANIGQTLINQLIYDEGAPDDRAGHRTAVLGINNWNANMIDVGVGLVRIPSPNGFGYYYIMALVLGKHQF